MADTKTIIEQAYSAFNKRDIDGALALMTQDVSWPKASEGGKVVGKEEIRAYWTRQWGEAQRARLGCGSPRVKRCTRKIGGLCGPALPGRRLDPVCPRKILCNLE
jgi:ketosteroid isomerase-like protein